MANDDMNKAKRTYAIANLIQNTSCLMIMALVLVPMLICLCIFLFNLN